MFQYTKIKGLIAAVFTPFTPDGKIHLDLIPEYAQRLKMQGLAGVFVNGSTGEGMMLTIEERKAIIEKWVEFSDENFKIIVHVGSSSVEIAKQLSGEIKIKSPISQIKAIGPYLNFFIDKKIALLKQCYFWISLVS
jgi:N-acetylneuraminate lyase